MELSLEDLALFNGELLSLGSVTPVSPASSSPEQLLSPSLEYSTNGLQDGFIWPTTKEPSKAFDNNFDVLSELLNSSSSSAASEDLPQEAEWLDVRMDLSELLAMPTANTANPPEQFQTVHTLQLSDLDMASLLAVPQAPEPTEAAVEEVPADMLEMLSSLTEELVSGEQPEQPRPADHIELSSEAILSPVSLEDVESILSSGPSSPAAVESSSVASPASSSCEESLLAAELKAPLPTKRRGRQPAPYAREPKSNDRKQRKKQQNKDAALRYRMKKKEESSTMVSECDQLEARNRELKEKVDTMTREINYLKSLMAEVYKAKGLLKV